MKKHLHLIAVAILLFFCCCIACKQVANNKQNQMESTNGSFTEGKDYLLLKRFRMIDNQGFGQPVEAFSFLMPANWETKGGVQWQTARCLSDIVQASLHATSPDKAYELYVFPTTQFDWVDDPMMLDALKKGGIGLGCHIAAPLDASAYIQQVLGSMVNAQVLSVQPIVELDTYMKQEAVKTENGMKAAGIQGYSFRPSAAEGKLQFADGNQGFALCSISQMISSIPSMTGGGGMINNFQTFVNMRTVLKYPKGKEDQARRLLSTMQSSVRLNMQWINAIGTMMNNIRKNIQDQTWKRIQINQQAQEEISNNITRSWEARNESQDKSNEIWSQYLRGVDSWTDDGGNKIELSSGYSNAWSKGDGSYILTDNPAFDPNVVLQEDWKPLKK